MSDPLAYLFPIPSLPLSRLAPPHSPSVSPASTETLQSILKDNHTKWHVFYNKLRFHNHAPHRAIALWTLGADADVIRKRYETDCGYEKPLLKSPEIITGDNFDEHLGDDRYFDAYIQFFAKYVKENGFSFALEQFIFSVQANTGMNPDLPIEKQPQMLNRFFSGVLHPFIHIGYGAEFGLPGLLVEGLAGTAVHHSPPLFLFTEDSNTNLSPKPHPAIGGPHALTILARVLCDTKFVPLPDHRKTNVYPETSKKYGKEIAAHVNGWNIDPRQLEHGWEKKVEEIVWTVVVLYGVAGWRNKETGFTADFYLMHLVTSSIFLPSICALISPLSRARLLKGYLAATCVWAVARGRPSLDVKGFVEDMQRSDAGMCSESGSETLWVKWIELAKVHPDEHLTKIIRSLAWWARVFGSRRARLPLGKKVKSVRSGLFIDPGVANDQLQQSGGEGEITFEGMSPRHADVDSTAAGSSGNEGDYIPSTELPGSEYLDGSLFLSVAILTFKRMGWDIQDGKVVERISKSKEGELDRSEAEFWDFDIPFY